MTVDTPDFRGNRACSPTGRALGLSAAICGLAFVAVLGIAAYFDATIRLLHLFEALPYLLAAALCWRVSKQGFALGAAAGGLWFWMGAFGTTFIENGLQQLAHWVQSGRLERPDLLLALPAGASTLGLVIFAAAGYARYSQKRWTDIGVLALHLLLVFSFFLAIFAAFAPRYLGVFGIHVAP